MGVKVRERKPGEWWIYIDHKGRRKAVKVGSKSAAKASAVDIEKKLTSGKLDLNRGDMIPVTFEKYAEKWMEQHIEANCKPGTADTTRKALTNHLLPAFGTFHLADINRGALRSYCAAKKADGYASSTIRVHMSCISGPMEMAVEDGLLPANPCAGARKHARGVKAKRPIDALTQEETSAFLTAAREHTPRVYPLFLTGLRTGMRIGEIVALEWGDIDWRGKFIVVQRNFWQGTLGTPKNGKTRRVDMSDQLVAELNEHKRRMAAESLKAGRSLPEYIFSTVEGRRVWPARRQEDPRRLDEEGGHPEIESAYLPPHLRHAVTRGESVDRLRPAAARALVDQHDGGRVRAPGPGGESRGGQRPRRPSSGQ